MLVVTGTSAEDNGLKSGLTEPDQLNHQFYRQDCQTVGVKPGPNPRRRLTNLDKEPNYWDRLPTIAKPAIKIEPPPPESFYADDDMRQMDIRLANMAYYCDQIQKFIDDINEERVEKT